MSSKAKQDIPQGQPQEVIGGGLATGVINQLIAREELVSQSPKSKDHLMFFNGNGSWARLVSSVNTLTEKEATDLASGDKSIKETVGNKNLAYNNVLLGGTIKQNTSDSPTKHLGGVSSKVVHSPIKLNENGYVEHREPSEDDKVIKTSSYHKYESLGFRPTPGIESVEITSKGTYGVLREGTVSFKVWTLEDLEVMTKLYLRPGYTVLLEWGHSLQLQNTGGINPNIETYKKFLNNTVEKPIMTFQNELNTIAKQSDYNYDSFVGYVSNFNWAINSEGGYDCSIKVIALGSVLESISVTFDPSSVYPPDQMENSEKSKGKKERKSIYHKFFMELQKSTGVNSTAVTAVNDVIEGKVENAVELAGSLSFNKSWKDNLSAVNTFMVKEAAGAATLIINSGQAIEDLIFGSEDESKSLLEAIDSAEGKLAMEDSGFKSKIKKLKKGDDSDIDVPGLLNDNVTFGGIDDGNNFPTVTTFASLDVEKIIAYLSTNFGKYGYKFENGEGCIDATCTKVVTQAGFSPVQQKIIVTSTETNTPRKVFDVDNITASADERSARAIADYIIENAYLPDSKLTEQQLAARQVRKKLKQQAKDDLVNAQQVAKDTKAEVTGLEPADARTEIYTKGNFAQPTAAHLKQSLNDFVAFRLKDLEAKDTGLDNDDLNEFWIPLYTVLDIYNNYITLIDGTKKNDTATKTPGRKLTEFYTGFQDKNPTSQVYEKKLTYLTTDYHFSIDPMVCILPKLPKLTTLKDSTDTIIKWPDSQGNAYPMGVVFKNGFHQNVSLAFQKGQMRGGTNDILNILISCDFLEKELEKILQQDEDSDRNENNNIVHLLKIVLKAMNSAMGNVNDLDLFYDELDDRYYIVDRKITPANRQLIPKLSLSGKKSTMTNVSISSQISNQIGNMVSIAAQGSSSNSKENVGTLLKWNKGLLDRHIRHKSKENDDNTDAKKDKRELPEDTRLKSWIKDYYEYWQEFNGENWFDNGDYNAGIVSALKNYHRKFSKKYVTEEFSKGDKPSPPPGVIPIELSFTTIGIAGLKIGQTFTIEQGLLPADYAKDFGYIITGLSHKIQGSTWLTDIKTQFYYLTPPTAAEIADHKLRTKIETGEFVKPATSGESGNPGVVFPYDANAVVPGDGSVFIKGGNFSKLIPQRNQPIQQRLMDIIAGASKATGLTFRISSAGQIPLPQGEPGRDNKVAVFTGNGVLGTNATGAARHDNGWAVDGALSLTKDNFKKIPVHDGNQYVIKFLEECRKRGLHSVGVGKEYMGGTSLHLDIACGTSTHKGLSGCFNPFGPKPSWLAPLMKRTIQATGPNKNYFKKSDNYKASDGVVSYTRGY